MMDQKCWFKSVGSHFWVAKIHFDSMKWFIPYKLYMGKVKNGLCQIKNWKTQNNLCERQIFYSIEFPYGRSIDLLLKTLNDSDIDL